MNQKQLDVLIFYLWLACASILVGLIASVVVGAPAPLSRRDRPVDPAALHGAHAMFWVGAEYEAHFRPDGSYEARAALHPGGAPYVGGWHLDGRTLVIRETTTPERNDWTTYRVLLQPCLRCGSIGGGEKIDFRLEAPRLRKPDF